MNSPSGKRSRIAPAPRRRLIARLRVALAGGAVVLLVAVVAGVFAVEQRDMAEDQAAAAVAAGTVADARRAGARALATDDLDEAMLLAVAGVQLDDSVETRSSLLAVLGRYPELIASTQMAGPQVLQLDVSPSGRTVATYDVLNHVRLYELATGALLAEYQAGHDSWPTWVSGQARFSPDGRTLAVVMAAPTRGWSPCWTPRRWPRWTRSREGSRQGAGSSLDLAFSPDGGRLAAAAWRVRGSGNAMRTARPWVFVWDLQRPQSPVFRKRLPEGNPGVALNAHGDVLFTTGNRTLPSSGMTSMPVHRNRCPTRSLRSAWRRVRTVASWPDQSRGGSGSVGRTDRPARPAPRGNRRLRVLRELLRRLQAGRDRHLEQP